MNIALLGYGKMGKTIEKLALEKGYSVVYTLDANELIDTEQLSQADVAIEFSRPEGAVDNIKACIEQGIPVVSGTTGWLGQMEEVQAFCKAKKGAFFYASNFSIGVNIFFQINKKLAALMKDYPTYSVSMEEVHHTEKLDAPSGTAITLAQGIIEQLPTKTSWVNEATQESTALPIISKRIDKTPGTHTVVYESSIDKISIEHLAHSRLGFASGALLAAEWLRSKEGCFGMEDLLNL